MGTLLKWLPVVVIVLFFSAPAAAGDEVKQAGKELKEAGVETGKQVAKTGNK